MRLTTIKHSELNFLKRHIAQDFLFHSSGYPHLVFLTYLSTKPKRHSFWVFSFYFSVVHRLNSAMSIFLIHFYFVLILLFLLFCIHSQNNCRFVNLVCSFFIFFRFIHWKCETDQRKNEWEFWNETRQKRRQLNQITHYHSCAGCEWWDEVASKIHKMFASSNEMCN